MDKMLNKQLHYVKSTQNQNKSRSNYSDLI